MDNHNATPTSFKLQSKSKVSTTQLETIFQYLNKKVATATMVSKATSIPQKNITRYKRDLEKNGLLKEIEKKPCKITGFKAWFITCNPDKFPANNQLKLL